MQTVLVTGGTGFLGQALVDELRKSYQVLATGREGENPLPPGVEYIGPDIDEIKLADLAFCDAVYHLAAVTDTLCQDEALIHETNVEMANRLFSKCAQVKVSNVVAASSAAVYGNGPCPFVEVQQPRPLNPYALSKLNMEERLTKVAISNPATKFVALRLSNIFGPGEDHKGKTASMIHQLYLQMERGNPRLFESGNEYRDWLNVLDAVQAFMLAGQADRSDVYNIGSGDGVTFNMLVMTWNAICGWDRAPEYIRNPYESAYQSATWHDISKAGRHLEFTPKYSMVEGMHAMHKSRRTNKGSI